MVRDPILPLDRAAALDPCHYVDLATVALERAHVLAPAWHYVGHAGQLTDAGDHLVAEIAGQPLIVVRQADGSLRAFHNVCRHRAGPLALTDGRGAKRLRCHYHGWQYGLDGCLRAAPEMREAAGFDKADVRLPEVSVKIWQGLVFATLIGDPAAFDATFAQIAARIAPQTLDALIFHRHDRYEVACNWKVYVDNYAEGYHLPYVHPALTRAVDYADYRSELADGYSLQVSPIADPQGPYGDGTAFYFLVYPNLMLNIVPGRLQLNRVIPLAIDRCAVDFVWFYADDPAVRARIADDLSFTDRVQAEDAAICEHVQCGLTAGGYAAGRLSPQREAGVWHFHNRLRRDLAHDG